VGIRPGRTVTPSVSLTVPSQYNCYLVVGTARAPASLDPREPVPWNTTTREVGLEVGDFDLDGGDAPRDRD